MFDDFANVVNAVKSIPARIGGFLQRQSPYMMPPRSQERSLERGIQKIKTGELQTPTNPQQVIDSLAQQLFGDMAKGGGGEGEKKEQTQKSNMTIVKPTPEGGQVKISVDIPEGQQATPTPTPTIIPEFQGVNQPVQNLIGSKLSEAGLMDQINNFINLAARESSLNPSTINRNNMPVPEFGGSPNDYGLFQFNEWYQQPLLQELGLTPEDLLDPVNAIMAMIELYRRKGYSQHPATAGPLGLLE